MVYATSRDLVRDHSLSGFMVRIRPIVALVALTTDKTVQLVREC